MVATAIQNTMRIPVAVLWIDIFNNADTEAHNVWLNGNFCLASCVKRIDGNVITKKKTAQSISQVNLSLQISFDTYPAVHPPHLARCLSVENLRLQLSP